MKTITIQVPDWVDENLIKEIVQVIIKYELKKGKTKESIEELKKMLEKLPSLKPINYEKLEEIYYEAKAFD